MTAGQLSAKAECSRIVGGLTSAIIMWQSKVPFPPAWEGLATWEADLGHDWGAEGHVGDEVAVHDVDLVVMRGQLSLKGEGRETVTWIQSALSSIVSEHAFPRAPKSADRMEGAMMADGDMTRRD